MKRFLTYGLIVNLLVLTACSDDDSNEAQGPQPEVPPAYTMSPSFGTFDGDNAQQRATFENWTYAATNVGIYSSILSVSLAIPVTAFTATIDQAPTFNSEENRWEWVATYNLNNAEYTILLTGEVVSTNSVRWRGFISQTNGVQDFLWFEGNSAIDGSNGSWRLFESPSNPSAWISSEWTRNSDDSQASVEFTVEKEGPNKGSSILYERIDNADFDRSVDIADINLNSTINIDWNSEDNSGRVRSEARFNTTDFQCWNAQLQNIDCQL